MEHRDDVRVWSCRACWKSLGWFHRRLVVIVSCFPAWQRWTLSRCLLLVQSLFGRPNGFSPRCPLTEFARKPTSSRMVRRISFNFRIWLVPPGRRENRKLPPIWTDFSELGLRAWFSLLSPPSSSFLIDIPRCSTKRTLQHVRKSCSSTTTCVVKAKVIQVAAIAESTLEIGGQRKIFEFNSIQKISHTIRRGFSCWNSSYWSRGKDPAEVINHFFYFPLSINAVLVARRSSWCFRDKFSLETREENKTQGGGCFMERNKCNINSNTAEIRSGG